MPPTTDTVIQSIKTRLTVLTITVVFSCLTVIGGAAYVFFSLGETQNTLCVFRSDLQSRVNEGNKFLANHPNGFGGISAATLKISIENEERTLEALGGLSC